MAENTKKPDPELLRPFYYAVGAEQIFISHRIESDVWVQVTKGNYPTGEGRSKIGTTEERVVIEKAVKILNDDWVIGDRFTTPAAIMEAMEKASRFMANAA